MNLPNQLNTSEIVIRDLSKELEYSVDKSNRILEKYLVHRMKVKGLTCGRSSAQDILHFMKEEEIVPPNGCRSLIKWLNYQLYSAIKNGVNDFTIQEIEGARLGINFVWWLKCIDSEQP